MAGQPSYPGAPRWLKVSAIATVGMAILLAVMVHGGSELRHHISSIGDLSHSGAQEGGR